VLHRQASASITWANPSHQACSLPCQLVLVVLLCLLRVYAERPSGSSTCAAGAAGNSKSTTSFTPPFGSCGNLMALSHGSITHQHLSSHVLTSRQGSGNRRSSGSGSGHGPEQPSCSQMQGGNGSSSNRGTGGSSTQPAEEGHASRATATAAAAAAAAGLSDCKQPGRCGTAAPVSAAASHSHTAGPSSADPPEAATGVSAAPSEQKLSIKNARFALSEDEASSPVKKALAWDTGETSTAGSRISSDAGGSPAPAQGVRLIGAAVGSAAGGARGTTVCIAAVGRSDHTHDDEVRPHFIHTPAHGHSLVLVSRQGFYAIAAGSLSHVNACTTYPTRRFVALLLSLQDSDDEVLVPIEDVLVPHPEDFVDAETLGLTAQVRTCPLPHSMHAYISMPMGPRRLLCWCWSRPPGAEQNKCSSLTVSTHNHAKAASQHVRLRCVLGWVKFLQLHQDPCRASALCVCS